MSKKKKLEINEQELAATTLVKLKDEKKASVFGVFWIVIIFGILIFGVYYLPDIAKYVNSYLHPELVEKNSNNNTTNIPDVPDNQETKEKDLKEYDFDSTLVIETEKFKVEDFNINSGNLVFKIKNIGTEVLNFGTSHYYIHLYNADKTLLQRIFVNEGVISSGETHQYTYKLNDSNIIKLTFFEIDPSEYTQYNVTSDEYGIGYLTCTKDMEEIKYKFNTGKLIEITNTQNIIYNETNYESINSIYSNLVNANNNVTGVTSSLEKLDNYLVYKTIVNLSSATKENVNMKNIYDLNTSANIIKFELEASGYKCN